MADTEQAPYARHPPTFQRALLAGAISGVAVDFILFPLDTIKTRVQSSQGFVASGGFKGVYRGVGSVGFGSAPGAAAFFVTYETLKKHVPKLSSSLTTTSSMTHLLAATGGEFVSCLIRVPTEIVKSRTQTGAYGPGKSSWHSLVQTMRYEGIRGFYRGFGITIARELPFTSLQFPLYEALKGQLSKRYLDGKRPSPGQAAICGSIAGGFAGAVTCPLDVVKTRVMLEAKTAMPAADGTRAPRQPSPSVLSFGPRLAQIFRNEGFAALFAGWIPRTSAIATGGAVFLGIYDFAVNFGKENPSEAIDKAVS